MSTISDNNGGDHPPCITEFKDDGSLESHRYYLARKITLEMLKDRGYNVSDSETNCSLAAFRTVFGNNPEPESLRLCISHRSSSKKMMVVFMGTNEVRLATIRALAGQIVNKESLGGLILVLQNKINSFARKEIEKFPFKVEVFQITELLINITKHTLSPKHEILTPEEKNQLLLKHHLEDKQLPMMLRTDVIAKYYGLEKGQVVKVTYPEELVGKIVTYRCVV